MVWGTSHEVRLFEHPFPVNSEMDTVGIVDRNVRDSPGMADIVSCPSVPLIYRIHHGTDVLEVYGPVTVVCTHGDHAMLDVSGIPDRVPWRSSPASPSSDVPDKPRQTSAPYCSPSLCSQACIVLCRLQY